MKLIDDKNFMNRVQMYCRENSVEDNAWLSKIDRLLKQYTIDLSKTFEDFYEEKEEEYQRLLAIRDPEDIEVLYADSARVTAYEAWQIIVNLKDR